jgi:ADP-ribose pyrophosphatase
MTAPRDRSRVESSAKTVKPTASPRADMHRKATHAKSAAAKQPLGKGKPVAKAVTEGAKHPVHGKEKLLSSKVAYKGKVFDVYTDTIIEPGGHKNTRDVIRHNGSVVIIAVDESKNPDDPDVILERQYRHAAGQFLIELPAGTRDKGEAPLAAAKREMIEETGFRAKKWTMLVKYFASPGFLGEWMQIFVARDLRQGEAKLEADEHLEVFRMPLSEAMRMVAEGKIHDGKTLIGLSLFDAARRDGRL